MPSKLHLWSFGPDTVSAADEDDALAIMRETIGDDALEDYEGETPTMITDDEPFTIYLDGWENDALTKTAGEWAAERGREWFGSTEF
jgi:hypothetical protein